MTTIAVYLFFVSVLSGYRSSKYWPNEIKAIAWLGKFWWSWGSTLLGIILLLIEKGYTIGLLLSLCLYITLAASVIFFTNCNRPVRLLALILFHMMCTVGLIFKF